jgi:uncharacterized coiled-coil DUF342 family protein
MKDYRREYNEGIEKVRNSEGEVAKQEIDELIEMLNKLKEERTSVIPEFTDGIKYSDAIIEKSGINRDDLCSQIDSEISGLKFIKDHLKLTTFMV